MENKDLIIELTADIVSAYVENNTVPVTDVSGLIKEVHGALAAAASGEAVREAQLKPPVPIKRSVQNDYIICLEDGKKFKSLKRHLRSHYDMSPAEYREKWGLSPDYPMVAPAYAKRRSELARQMGLGKVRRK